jgi:hypothetical protein
MTSRLVGRLLVISHEAGIPPDDEWNEALTMLSAHDLEQLRVLVFTEGGGPSPAQQARLAKVLARWSRTLLVAVVSDNTGIRFLASALALFLKRIRTFTRTDVTGAYRYLELSHQECQVADQLSTRSIPPQSKRAISRP